MRFIIKNLFLCFTLLHLLPASAQKKDSATNSGKASFYHDSFQGQETSNGEFYDKNDFTAAHRTLPFNTIVNVYNKQNGKHAIVRVNDRGPFVRSRIIDLSHSAAMKLQMVPFGVAPVTIQVMNLFDHLPWKDSTFIENDIWDCFGRMTELSGKTILVWQTEYWKHAFYMASHIALDYHLPAAQIRISGDLQHRKYQVLVSNLTEKAECDALISKLKTDGFISARMFKEVRKNNDSLKVRQHGDQ